jgi:hypothetical protein
MSLPAWPIGERPSALERLRRTLIALTIVTRSLPGSRLGYVRVRTTTQVTTD